MRHKENTSIKKMRFRWDKSSPLYEPFVLELYSAYEKGYSVVEIGRYLCNQTTYNLYALMRDEGILPKLSVGRPRKLDVNTGLLAALKECRLSFTKWCNSHSLSPEAVAMALSTPENSADPQSAQAHSAFRQDFQYHYNKCYQLPVPLGRASMDSEESKHMDYTMKIFRNRDKGCYEAVLEEVEESRVYGASWEEAFYALRQQYVFLRSIAKLKLLPPRRMSMVPASIGNGA